MAFRSPEQRIPAEDVKLIRAGQILLRAPDHGALRANFIAATRSGVRDPQNAAPGADYPILGRLPERPASHLVPDRPFQATQTPALFLGVLHESKLCCMKEHISSSRFPSIDRAVSGPRLRSPRQPMRSPAWLSAYYGTSTRSTPLLVLVPGLPDSAPFGIPLWPHRI